MRALRAAAALCLVAGAAAAHLDFAARQRVEVEGRDVVVTLWADASHLPGADPRDPATLGALADATGADTAAGPCRPAGAAWRDVAPPWVAAEMRLRCPAPPSRLRLGGAAAVGSRGPQYVEVVADGSVRGSVRTARASFDLGAPPRGAGLLLPAGLAAIAAAGVLSHRRRGTTT